jgi:hypothetical protein
MRYFSLFFVCVIPFTVHALEKISGEDITVCWTPPTAYTNNSPLPPSELDHHTVYWECDAKGPGNIDVAMPNTCLVLRKEVLGNCSISVTATTTNSATSVKSDSVELLVKLPKPSYGGFR